MLKNERHYHTGATFNGLPVVHHRGPLYAPYLNRLYETLNLAMNDYSRLFVVRFDLHYPKGIDLNDELYGNGTISRFAASLKAKIKYNRQMAGINNIRVHDTKVRYVWAREIGQGGIPHYHVALLLNHDAFFTLGDFNGENNLMYKITSAWCSVLNLSQDYFSGLVHVPNKNPTYKLNVNDINGFASSYADAFERLSYLCKVETKFDGDWVHSFDASQG